MSQDPLEFVRRESISGAGIKGSIPLAAMRPKTKSQPQKKINIDRPSEDLILSDEDDEEEE
jgi:hypothetical protein